MAEIRDIIYYIIQNYPPKLIEELSNARLTKMVYLADWHSCINRNIPISPITWKFDNHGPFVPDIKSVAQQNPNLFFVQDGQNMYGGKKTTFGMKDTDYSPVLTENEKSSIDHIINVTRKLYWADFINLVYATHPIASSERQTELNLIEKAKEYNSLRAA